GQGSQLGLVGACSGNGECHLVREVHQSGDDNLHSLSLVKASDVPEMCSGPRVARREAVDVHTQTDHRRRAGEALRSEVLSGGLVAAVHRGSGPEGPTLEPTKRQWIALPQV